MKRKFKPKYNADGYKWYSKGYDDGFKDGKEAEHKKCCRDKSNCKVCKGEVEL